MNLIAYFFANGIAFFLRRSGMVFILQAAGIRQVIPETVMKRKENISDKYFAFLFVQRVTTRTFFVVSECSVLTVGDGKLDALSLLLTCVLDRCKLALHGRHLILQISKVLVDGVELVFEKCLGRRRVLGLCFQTIGNIPQNCQT